MRYSVQATFILLLSIMLLSCSGRERGAADYLIEAETAYKQGNYSLAKLKIDSIKVLFPKAYDEINTGFALMQDIRMAENRRNIVYCDSMLSVNYSLLNELLTKFDYVRDDRYQEFGEYYPKAYPHSSSLERNGLRSGVKEKGTLFIESVLAGNAIKHSKIRASADDGTFAETLSVTADGLNYRFNTLNKSYEIVRFSGNDENNVAKFIYTYKEKPITIHFIGNRTVTVSLTNAAKDGVSHSFELSNLLLNIEQLKFEKEKSETLIRYLESRSQ